MNPAPAPTDSAIDTHRLAVALIIAAVAAGSALLARCALAQTADRCGSHDQMSSRLANKYSERTVWQGLDDGGALAQLWQSPGGTWTMLRIMPTGMACIIGTGQMGEVVALLPGEPA